jgi:predicted dehydrogenase
LGGLVTRIGVLGLSDGNGHPFSFSAIINGFSDKGFANAGWDVIHQYLRRRDDSEFGIDDIRVTHAWTQDEQITTKLCEACLISNKLARPEEMLGQVDAVIVARDDFENHFGMAMPFLKAGVPVLVDKPLSLDVEQLRGLKSHLEAGKLMSSSGMRYARELDEPRAGWGSYGPIKLIRGAVVLSWEKYGVHLVDAILNLTPARPISVSALRAPHASFAIEMSDGSLLQIDALGDAPKTFRIDIWGARQCSTHEITDNFSMFRRLLWHFAQMIKTAKPPIDPADTLNVMRTLIAGRISASEKRAVLLDEIQI